MPLYMFQAGYKGESWKTQMEGQQDARGRISGLVESVGGKMIDAYYTFGDRDLLIIADLPDNHAAAAVSLTASAGGSLTGIKSSPLLTLEEGKEVLGKAAKAAQSYKAPIR
jgi:uncharacterized protein with GYD domain